MNSIKIESDGEITLSNLRFRKESFSIILSTPDDYKLEDNFEENFYQTGLFDSDSSSHSFDSVESTKKNSYETKFNHSQLPKPNVTPSLKGEEFFTESFESKFLKRGRSISVDLINSFIKKEETKQTHPNKVIIVADDDQPDFNTYSRDRGLSMDLIASLLETDETDQPKQIEKYLGPGSLMPKNPFKSDRPGISTSSFTEYKRPPTPEKISTSVNAPSLPKTNIPNNVKRIGIYTVEERKARIARFHEKRKRRVWRKKIKYDCRKKLAESRPRVKGRFVRRGEPGDYYPPPRAILKKSTPYEHHVRSNPLHCPLPMFRTPPSYLHPSPSIRLT
mmetsp:Transcript_40694/g.53590  ORF Transcript_40694/g.53590 Transcript_40694/m.53590 type:complete len:334 (+) Transcript_40694:174-1175(+)|eukprot:CAMPEP_0117744522 /NCGR_PEP_ID=MMETSP0947-20121206/6810_1 /TAXON_ID=44440 /ORGANISM="Chattonella subsalsa, Strain CCMP2191" /LENGTH=333 /DNA_ID=CAMNT_0005561489 /DNA_START=132 /DNA_END=1133 /DNA_ORIENTATION=+